MRRARSTAVAAVVVLLSTACTPAVEEVAETPATAVTTAPVGTTPVTTTTLPADPRGGSVTIGMLREPVSLNPFLSPGSRTLRSIGRAVWSGAFQLDAERKPAPDLAVELPTLANGGLAKTETGGLSVSYLLDRRAVWSDGRPVTGSDFAYTYELATDGALGTDASRLYSKILAGSLSVGRSAVAYELIEPSTAYLELFALVLEEHIVSGTNPLEDWRDIAFPGAGPFTVRTWDQGDELVLEANRKFWKKGGDGEVLPYLDEVVVSFFGTEADLVAAFVSGDIDAAALGPDPAQALDLEELDGVDLQVDYGPEWEHWSFNFGQKRVESNPASQNDRLEFRRAVMSAIDRLAIAQAVYGDLISAPLASPSGLSWGAIEHDPWAVYENVSFDTDELVDPARPGLLPRVGFASTNGLERQTIGGVLLTQFAQAGVELDVTFEDTGVFFLDIIREGRWDAAVWAWRSTPGPSGLVSDLQARFLTDPSAGGFDFAGWSTAGDAIQSERRDRILELLTDLHLVFDLEDLAKRVSEIEDLLAEEAVILPLYPTLAPAVVRTDRLAGFHHVAGAPGDLWNIATWLEVKD